MLGRHLRGHLPTLPLPVLPVARLRRSVFATRIALLLARVALTLALLITLGLLALSPTLTLRVLVLVALVLILPVTPSPSPCCCCSCSWSCWSANSRLCFASTSAGSRRNACL